MTAALVTGAAMLVVMAFAWLVQRITANSGWVDACWSLGTGLIGAAGALLVAGDAVRAALVAACAALWGLRLGLHIAARTAGRPEDVRYAGFRAAHGAGFQRWMFGFMMVQAVAAWPLIGAILLAAANPAPAPRAADLLALIVLAAAVLGEAVADRQMERFRRDPAAHGRICDRGLWRYSRHPNYFFEWLGWCAYPLFAINLGGWAWGWLALAAPAVMYWLLMHVSGIPLLEAAMLQRRGAAYRDYQARTPAFFPWFPG